jgi:hypothetical protein
LAKFASVYSNKGDSHWERSLGEPRAVKYTADISFIIKKKKFIGFILDFTGILSLKLLVGLELLGLGLV